MPTKPSPCNNSSAPATGFGGGPDILSEELRAELKSLPRFADRRALAPIISRLLFPVSHRTLEVWPLKWRLVNGRAVADVAEALALAYRKFAAAPVVLGGPRPIDDDGKALRPPHRTVTRPGRLEPSDAA
jgi:hypothetical protein